MESIRLGDLEIEVELKDIKNIHLSVFPPSGRVHISAPKRMDLDTIRVFALSKLQWIKKQQQAFRSQVRETEREYLTRESHYYLGQRYLLKLIEVDAKPKIILKRKEILLHVRPGITQEDRQQVIEDWYRQELKRLIPPLIDHWERKIGVKASEFGVKKMRTRWGTCNPVAKRIWLNLELAKKPLECLEYIIVHELMHLREKSHNQNFITMMNEVLPNWRLIKQELNRLPISHVGWKY